MTITQRLRVMEVVFGISHGSIVTESQSSKKAGLFGNSRQGNERCGVFVGVLRTSHKHLIRYRNPAILIRTKRDKIGACLSMIIPAWIATKRFDVFMPFSEYGSRSVTCPHCKSQNIRRGIPHVRVAKSEDSRMEDTFQRFFRSVCPGRIGK